MKAAAATLLLASWAHGQSVLEANLQRASALERKYPGTKFACRKYAHLTEEAFLGRKPTVGANATAHRTVDALQATVDWRARGAVSPVKDQGACTGAGWAYSTTGNIEGSWFLTGNTLNPLSEQELIDCAFANKGCAAGGTQAAAFEWIMNVHNGQVCSSYDYPPSSNTTGEAGVCQWQSEHGAIISNYEALTLTEDFMVQRVLDSGPLATSVDPTGWQMYSSGVFQACQSGTASHGVLLVGMGNEGNAPYWIVKNSWGRTWGEQGYIRIPLGVDACRVTSNPIAGYAAY